MSSRETVAGWTLKRPGGGSGGLISFRNHLSYLGLLLRGELGAATPDAALLTGGIDSGLSAFPQHGALELREGPHHLHHHPAGRSGRVDRLGQAAESRSGFRELLHDREHVAQRAREPIQLPDNDDVTAAKLIEEPEELGPLPTSTGSLLAEDALAPSRFEPPPLEQRCPDRRWKRGRNRSTLHKGIANHIGFAIPFRNA